MYQDYPNLELLEYQAREILQIEKREDLVGARFLRCYADVFAQEWSDTSTGLRDSQYEFAGRAITEAYTTVLKFCWQVELQDKSANGFSQTENKECWIVFLNNQPAYLVDNPTPEFFEDLKNRNLVSKLEAETRY